MISNAIKTNGIISLQEARARVVTLFELYIRLCVANIPCIKFRQINLSAFRLHKTTKTAGWCSFIKTLRLVWINDFLGLHRAQNIRIIRRTRNAQKNIFLNKIMHLCDVLS